MASNLIISFFVFIIFALVPFSSLVEGGLRNDVLSKLSDEFDKVDKSGTKWAVLVAGSNTIYNYRHQANICHAYHILKRGGLKDENIIVFMYDDIAFNKENPVPGVIINNPHGKDVYRGVIKDYTGKDVNAENLYAVILGNETAVKGGSGKVLKSGPNDHVFIYYTDHGGAGALCMPGGAKYVYAKDFIEVLKKKHAANSYKSMVLYIEACESGSIFDGLLPENLNIYVTTSTNPGESGYACYCGGPDSRRIYQGICLGDFYSVAWMEDSDKCNSKETLHQQYLKVKERVRKGDKGKDYSHVMQYGDTSISKQRLTVYMGANSSKGSYIATNPNDLSLVEQREADLFYLREKIKRATKGSDEWIDARKQLDEAISHREFVDQSVAKLGEHLFGSRKDEIMYNVRPAGQPLLEDWDCFKALVKVYEERCGSLRDYGLKYMRAFANICNAGINKDLMTQVSNQVCGIGQK